MNGSSFRDKTDLSGWDHWRTVSVPALHLSAVLRVGVQGIPGPLQQTVECGS